MKLSLRAYAKHRGVNLSAVQKAISSGRIQVDPDGKIDQAAADKSWFQSTDASKQRDKVNRVPGDSDTRIAAVFAKAKAERESYQAKLAQLSYEQKAGKLVDGDQVKRRAFEMARRVRDSLLNIPNRIAAELAAETDPFKIHVILQKTIVESLEELTNVAAGPEVQIPDENPGGDGDA